MIPGMVIKAHIWLKYTELLEIIFILLAIDKHWFIAIYTKSKGFRFLELNTAAWTLDRTPIKSNITNSLSPNLSLYDLQNRRYDFSTTRVQAFVRKKQCFAIYTKSKRLRA